MFSMADMIVKPEFLSAPSGPEIQLSVIIPSCNASQTLGKLLASLGNQTFNHQSFEILVVDDGSTDQSQEIVRRSKIARLLVQPRSGPGAARNLGIAQSRGELVLFLDSDTEASPRLLQVHVDYHRAHPDVVATGGSVLPGVKLKPGSWALADHLCSWFNAHPDVRYRREPEYLPSLNFCVSRLAIERHRLRWEDGLHHTGEDVVFCRDLRTRGLRIAFVPEAVVYHHDRRDLRGYLRHNYHWGYHAPFVRGRLTGLRYSFLFPRRMGLLAVTLPVIVAGYSLLIWKAWLPRWPVKATLALPPIVVGRLAYALGVLRGTSDAGRNA